MPVESIQADYDREMLETLSTVGESRRYNAWIYDQIKNHLSGCVLDIGSGIGDIAHHYLKSGVNKVILTDHSQTMTAYLNQKFQGDARIEVLKMNILSDDCFSLIGKNVVDVITCSNVLEHIEDDYSALVKMRAMLKEKGRLVILVPALPCIYGSLDALVGHYRRYTKQSLAEVLLRAGFKIETQYYMNMFGIFTWYLAGRVLKHKKFNSKACAALDKFVPVLKSLEKKYKPFWGQTLVSVAG